MANEAIFRGRRVVLPAGEAAATIYVRDGRIERVSHYDDVPEGAPIIDAGDLVIMPGVVDSHVHVNEPGRTEWEGYASATLAAAAGGITTIVDMPLNSIPATTTARAVDEKSERLEGQCRIDVGLWGGAVPENTSGDGRGLSKVLARGTLGFKCFLVPSGVDEFPYVQARDVEAALCQLHGTDAVLMVHAELSGPIDAAAREMASESPPPDPRAYRTYLRSRPPEAEDQAIELLYDLCKKTRTPIHIVHLSSANALATLARAKDEGLLLTAETAPHYLSFEAEEIPDGATHYKCAPPIRDRRNRERLWKALEDGLISMVVSDHSPCTPDLKRRDTGDFMAAWGGIAGLQFSMPAVWTSARARGKSLVDLARWMCEAPAKHAGIAARKGSIAAGKDADFTFLAPDESFVVTAPFVHHKNKLTPYEGRTLYGVVHSTYLRGESVSLSATHDGTPGPRASGRRVVRT